VRHVMRDRARVHALPSHCTFARHMLVMTKDALPSLKLNVSDMRCEV
jgi:hypothetical protein